MSEPVLHYEVKARMTTEEYWTVVGWCSSKEALQELLEKYKSTYRYVIWNSYFTGGKK